jgi:hypothetical protein
MTERKRTSRGPLDIAGRLAASALLATLAGCATDGVEPSRVAGDVVARKLLASIDNGIEVRRWQVEDDAVRIDTALAAYADTDAIGTDDLAGLKRNGFRLFRIPIDDLDALLEDLGGAMLDMAGWHGQAYRWREIAGRPVEATACVVAIDGRIRRFDRGMVRLQLRGWTMPMEDGPHVYVELHAEHGPRRPGRSAGMISRHPTPPERFASTRLDLLLDRGYAYLLTCDGEPLRREAERDDRNENEPDDGAEDRSGKDEGQRRSGLGPEVIAPPTLGEWLLRRTVEFPPRREMLLLCPKIPPALYLSPMAAGVTASINERRP